jgi:tRNA 5-methylaminomethyl-2-thiouridine biosynthesis bifunctional protein
MPLQAATLAYTPDGTPFSAAYGDVYHTASGGLGQARHVFLRGNGLPERWQGRECFVIVETGFGLGLNFLATWAAWRDDPQRCARLHFISVEKHPFRAADLATLYAAWPATSEAAALAPLAPLAEQLQRHWPTLLPGFQRLHFDGGRVTLTLIFGDAARGLPQLDARADAFYLDGFSPARNPELWSPELCATLSRLAAPGATLATWSVASGVRESLTACGWSLTKAQGFSGKRHMLCGTWPGETPQKPAPQRHAIVIGAGIAGSSAAERLAARGWTVDVIDRESAAGQGGSGNLAGVLRPLPSLDDNRVSQIIRACFLYARRHFAALADAGLPLRWGATGALHLARDEAQEAAQKCTVDRQGPPADYLRFVGRAEASQLAGWPVAAGGWWFPCSGWVQPPSACISNLARHGALIRPHFGRRVDRIERVGELWRAFDAADQMIAEAPVLILANAADTRRFAPTAHLPLRAARGQVSHLPARPDSAPKVVVCRLGYVTPEVDGRRCAGASFLLDDGETALRAEEHAENLEKLDFMLPGFAAGLAADALDGRVGFRPVSPDRLPLVGAVGDAAAIDPATPSRPLKDMPRIPGLYVINGFGARGIVWSALATELLACLIAGEPLPLEAELAAALDPARFLRRGKAKRARQEPSPARGDA